MKAEWSFSFNDNDTVFVRVSCSCCGKQASSPLLENFQHGGPCGVRVEFPPEQIREQYAELKEADRPRIKPKREPSPNIYQPERFWLDK